MLAHLALMATLASPAAPLPERVLLLQDNPHHRAGVALLNHLLENRLLADPVHELVAPFPPPLKRYAAADLHNAARQQIRTGDQAFHRLDLQRAAARYGAAVQKLHRVAALNGDLSDLPKALRMLGATYLLLGDTPAAQTILRRLLALDPAFVPPTALYNPDMAAVVDALKTPTEVFPPLSLTASPADTEIWVDGQRLGSGAVIFHGDPAIPHYVFLVRGDAAPQAHVLEPDVDAASNISFSRSFVLPSTASSGPTASLTQLAQIARLPGGFPDPDDPALQALQVHEVWVLTEDAGHTSCVRFNLTTGHRHDAPPVALPTSWPDAATAAQQCAGAVSPSNT